MKYHTKFRLLINAPEDADPGSIHFSTIFYANFDTVVNGMYVTRISGRGHVSTRN